MGQKSNFFINVSTVTCTQTGVTIQYRLFLAEGGSRPVFLEAFPKLEHTHKYFIHQNVLKAIIYLFYYYELVYLGNQKKKKNTFVGFFLLSFLCSIMT